MTVLPSVAGLGPQPEASSRARAVRVSPSQGDRDFLALLHGELSVLQAELAAADVSRRRELFATRWEELRAAIEELSLELELTDAGLLGARLWITRLDHATGDPQERLAWLDTAEQLAQLSGALETRLKVAHLRAQWLRGQGQVDAACALLEQVLDADGARTSVTAPYLLHLFAELELLAARPAAALARLEAAEERLSPQDAVLRSALDGTRGQVLLEFGLIDRAAPWIEGSWERVQRARDAGVAVGRDECVAARLRRLNLRLAQGRFAGVARESAEALDQDPAFAPRDTWRTVLLLTRAEALLRSESDPQAVRACLREAEAGVGEPLVRQRAVLLSVALALVEGDVAEARALFTTRGASAAGGGGEGGAASRQLSASRLAMEAELALAEDAPHERLRELQEALGIALKERLEVWRAAPRLVGGVGFLAVPARRDWLSVLAMLDLKLEDEAGGERAFTRWLSCFEAVGGTLATDDWRSILEAKDDGVVSDARATVVSWLPATRRTLLWVANLDGVQAVVLAGEAQVERAAERLVRTLDTNPKLAAGAAHALGQALGGSALERLAVERSWTVLGRELIERVPLELVRLHPEGPPLGTTHAITHWTSFADAAAWRARPSGASRSDRYDFALLAAPELESRLLERFPEATPLDFGDRERELLLGAWGDADVLAHEGEGARYQALREALADGVRVLQIVAHGVLDETYERPGRLLLAPEQARGEVTESEGVFGEVVGGVIDARALEELAPDGPEFALVTTCHSGAGPRRPGQALAASLAGALLSARTRCVLATTRTIGYRATLELSRGLHDSLRSGASPAEALRVARAERFAEAGIEGLRESLPLQLWGLGHVPMFTTGENGHGRASEARRTLEASDVENDEGSAPKSLGPILFGAAALATLLLLRGVRRDRSR